MDYYTLWVHQIKTPIAASKLLVSEVADRQLKQQLEQEIFKIDSYTNLVLQYLRLESFHDDLGVEERKYRRFGQGSHSQICYFLYPERAKYLICMTWTEGL